MSEKTAPTPPRDGSIDVLRGLVMCLMVLDHVRDFSTSSTFSPTDPLRTNAALFFTRWVTHFCAPVFVLLAGVGTGISAARGKDLRALARFLFSRGLWLVFLELTWVRFGWYFNLDYQSSTAQVIWALGWCMVGLGALVFLPTALQWIVGLALTAGHDLLDPISSTRWGSFAWLWKILHEPGRIELAPGHVLYIAYPLLPWLGVMMLGYLLGRAWTSLDRHRLITIGATMIGAFLLLRVTNVYGDPHPFVALGGVRSLFSLLACEKYPPSLDYLLMTLGSAILLLGWLRGGSLDGTAARTLVAYGRAPLLFYLLHLPLVHAMMIPFRIARGLPLIAGPFRHGLDLSLPTVYGLWLLALVLLWWPTSRWAARKAARSDWWLSYL